MHRKNNGRKEDNAKTAMRPFLLLLPAYTATKVYSLCIGIWYVCSIPVYEATLLRMHFLCYGDNNMRCGPHTAILDLDYIVAAVLA